MRAPWLVTLLLMALVFYTDDYVIAGILPDLARDLEVTEAMAGQLVTVFSLTIVLSAPIGAALTWRVPRTTLFTVALGVFAAANLLAAATTEFWVLMGLRIVAAVCAGMATPAIFAWTAQHAPPDKVGRYISVVAMGVTGAIALGVPTGTVIAQLWNWRGSFLALAGVAVLLMLGVRGTLRGGDADDDRIPLATQLRAAATRPVWMTLLINVVAMSGSMMAFTYLTPYLIGVAPGHELRAFAFAASGIAGVAGVLLGGAATDRFGADRTILMALTLLGLGCAGSWALWQLGPFSSPGAITVVVLFGGLQAIPAFALSPAFTVRLAETAGSGANAAIALNTSGTYVGVTIAGALGGAVLAGTDAGGVVGAATVLVGVAVALALAMISVRTTNDY